MDNPIFQVNEIISKIKSKGLKTQEDIFKEVPYEYYSWASSWNPKAFSYKMITYSDPFLRVGKSFKEQIVIDLGCGPYLSAYRLCKIFGAKAYIGVDKYNSRDILEKFYKPEVELSEQTDERIKKLLNFLNKPIEDSLYKGPDFERLKLNLDKYLKRELKSLPASIVSEDMLDFLKRVPKNSVSILTGGIDKCMIPESQDEYADQIEKQIARVLHKDGVYVSICSRFEGKGLEKLYGDKGDDLKIFSR